MKVKLSLCLTIYSLRHDGVWGNRCIDPRFLDLETRWRWAVCFTPGPLYPRGNSPRYRLDTRLGGPQTGLDAGEKKKFLPLPGFELRPLGRPGRSQFLYRPLLNTTCMYVYVHLASAWTIERILLCKFCDEQCVSVVGGRLWIPTFQLQNTKLLFSKTPPTILMRFQ
jgi:hypothetical protein